MKKLINRPERVVEEMVQGILTLDAGLRRLAGRAVLVRDDLSPDRVALISGGGSGHEPAHAGYLGLGMLSAAVAGDVFTSPAPGSVLAAIQATAGPAGALLIVKNYTGDRLNFGIAAEIARGEGIPVEVVLVADDVALAGNGDHAGRRGLAGTVFVHKVAGAAAEAGLPLAEVAAEARAAAAAVRTMGVAMSPCLVPGADRPGFVLADGEVEFGLGIHGEPGVRRVPLAPADSTVDELLNAILDDLQPEPGARVALLVNNLGGSTAMELAIVARHAVKSLTRLGLKVERAYGGTLLSALEMAGVSLSVMTLDDGRLARLDAPTTAPAWPSRPGRPSEPGPPPNPLQQDVPAEPPPPSTPLGTSLETAIRAAAEALLVAEPELTDLDRRAGDGDLGITLARGARAIRKSLPTYPLDDAAGTLHALALTFLDALGGTSGPLYAAFFHEAATRLKSGDSHDANAWVEAFRDGCEAITRLGGARIGDRTMLDALIPAVAAATSAGTPVERLARAAEAARLGAEATANLVPRVGRSSYFANRVAGIPDPGASAVATWLVAVARALAGSPAAAD